MIGRILEKSLVKEMAMLGRSGSNQFPGGVTHKYSPGDINRKCENQ